MSQNNMINKDNSNIEKIKSNSVLILKIKVGRDFISEIKQAVKKDDPKMFAAVIRDFFNVFNKTPDYEIDDGFIHPLWGLKDKVVSVLLGLVKKKNVKIFSQFKSEKEIHDINFEILFFSLEQVITDLSGLLEDFFKKKIEPEWAKTLDSYSTMQAENIYARIMFHRYYMKNKKPRVLDYDTIQFIKNEFTQELVTIILFLLEFFPMAGAHNKFYTDEMFRDTAEKIQKGFMKYKAAQSTLEQFDISPLYSESYMKRFRETHYYNRQVKEPDQKKSDQKKSK